MNADNRPMTEHPILGWILSIPDPFWVRRWFRWKPACYECKVTFGNRDEHDRHWTVMHSAVGT